MEASLNLDDNMSRTDVQVPVRRYWRRFAAHQGPVEDAAHHFQAASDLVYRVRGLDACTDQKHLVLAVLVGPCVGVQQVSSVQRRRRGPTRVLHLQVGSDVSIQRKAGNWWVDESHYQLAT